MAKEKRPREMPWLPSLGKKEEVVPAEDAQTDALLRELAEAVRQTAAGDLVEERFRVVWPGLHFRVRQWFGSTHRAFTLLLKKELGRRWKPSDVLGKLDTWFRTGEPMSLDGLLRSDRHAAEALVEHFGSYEAAMSRAGLDPVLASYDRRCDLDVLAERGFLEWGFPFVQVSEAEVMRKDPLLLGRMLWAAGSLEGFSGLVERWLEGQSELWCMHERGQIVRMPLRVWEVTSRGARGRLLPNIEKVSSAFFAAGFGPGHRVCLVSSTGRAVPLDPAEVPMVGRAASGVAVRTVSWRKGERTVGLAPVGGRSPGLALVTRAGRIKVVGASHVGRFRTPEIEVMPVEGSDRVVLAAGLTPMEGGEGVEGAPGRPERLAVVMKSGRVAVFPMDAVPWASRRGKGSYRLSLARSGKDEPLAVVGSSAQRPDLVLATADGRVRRVNAMELPERRHEVQGVQVWPVTLVGAAAGGPDDLVWMVSRHGRLLAFPMEDIRRSKGGRQGVVGMDLHGGDATVAVGCTPVLGEAPAVKEAK